MFCCVRPSLGAPDLKCMHMLPQDQMLSGSQQDLTERKIVTMMIIKSLPAHDELGMYRRGRVRKKLSLMILLAM